MTEDFDMVAEFDSLPDKPSRRLVGALRACSADDLREAVEELAKTDAAPLFHLAEVAREVNPSLKVPGVPLDYVYWAQLRITGLAPGVDESTARVNGIRVLRQEENCTIKEAHTICKNIIAGQVYAYPVEYKTVAEQRAAHWRRAGFAYEIVPHGEPPPEYHLQSFAEVMACVCTG